MPVLSVVVLADCCYASFQLMLILSKSDWMVLLQFSLGLPNFSSARTDSKTCQYCCLRLEHHSSCFQALVKSILVRTILALGVYWWWAIQIYTLFLGGGRAYLISFLVLHGLTVPISSQLRLLHCMLWIQELLPINKRTIEHFTVAFEGPELQPIVDLQVNYSELVFFLKHPATHKWSPIFEVITRLLCSRIDNGEMSSLSFLLTLGNRCWYNICAFLPRKKVTDWQLWAINCRSSNIHNVLLWLYFFSAWKQLLKWERHCSPSWRKWSEMRKH